MRHKIEGQSHVLNQLQKYEQNEASNLRIIQQAIARNKADQVLYLKEKIQKVKYKHIRMLGLEQFFK